MACHRYGRGLVGTVDRQPSVRDRARQVREAVAETAEQLGNTSAVARKSYVDPRVIELFDRGETVGRPRMGDGRDRAVVRLLRHT